MPILHFLPTLLLAFAEPAAASAAATAAENHITRGRQLREQRQDDAALAEFEKAYKLHPTPRARVQIALAQQALGRWLEAEATLGEALAAKSDPYIAQWSPTLDKALADIRGHIGEIQVQGTPAGAQIFVNGRGVGTLPLASPVRVVAGSVTLELRHPDHHPTARNVTVPGGGLARERIELVPVAATSPPPPPPLDPTVVVPGPITPPTPGQPGERDQPPPDPRRWKRLAGYGALTASALALGLGVYSHVQRENKVNQFNGHRECDEKLPQRGPLPACAILYDDFRASTRWAVAAYLGGAALAGVGTFLLITAAGDDPPAQASARPRLLCAPGLMLGLACSGRF